MKYKATWKKNSIITKNEVANWIVGKTKGLSNILNCQRITQKI